jgi:rubrerythrin
MRRSNWRRQGETDMPSSCPKCRRVLDEDEICCAQVRYTWRCKSCFKLTSGFAIPYGKCFMCGGELEVIPGRDLGDSMRFRAIRDAVQFELDSFHFYKLARDKAHTPEQRAVLEGLYEAELDHLHELEEKYHAHLDREVVELSANEQTLLSNWLFRGIEVTEDSGLVELYQAALEMERRTRDHFKKLAREVPPGLEAELCEELAAEEEEHVAMLEMELEQIG